MSSSSSTPPKALNRWNIGLLSILQLICGLFAFLALNYLASQHFYRLDWSRDANYSLSQSTQSFLKSNALTNQKRTIRWIVLCRKTTPFYERVRALTEEYVRFSNQHIEVEIVDPLRSPDRVQQITAAYGVSLVKDMIIMDARSDDQEPSIREEPQTGLKALHPHIKIALLEEMITYSQDSKSGRKPTAFQGEEVLTARLVETIEGKPKKMLFFADKSRLDDDGQNSPWNVLSNTFRLQNIDLEISTLSALSEVPANVDCVALIAPKFDLSDSELKVLQQYWLRPKASILILLKPDENTPKLRSFLRLNGITPRRDRVVSIQHGQLRSEAKGIFSPGVDFLNDLKGQSVVFEGASSSLEVRENAPELQSMSIFPIPLIETDASFWGETKFGSGKEAFQEQEDIAGPLALAAAVTRGDTKHELHDDASRMIVLSNVDCLNLQRQRPENLDFLNTASNWLIKRGGLIGSGPRTLGTYKLPLLDHQVSRINRLNYIIIPLIFAFLGLSVWFIRRS